MSLLNQPLNRRQQPSLLGQQRLESLGRDHRVHVLQPMRQQQRAGKVANGMLHAPMAGAAAGDIRDAHAHGDAQGANGVEHGPREMGCAERDRVAVRLKGLREDFGVAREELAMVLEPRAEVSVREAAAERWKRKQAENNWVEILDE
ncbi:hypothetical protein NQ176_g4523 [Zarea fungicola]|uniref:Uncharacterized protein n=1 Tax=Zarea fungicola TaxID=93591 RepID=A0ACC1NEE4_9HYPO|nr:hypothetical protein NQ176_g4523 [Lecanicillium fungicola]